ADSNVGVIFSSSELQLLLNRIGSTPAWDFIHIRKEFGDERWTQACGRAEHGLVVEINGPRLVANRNDVRCPLVDVGTSTWPYFAGVAELHSVEDAAVTQLRWLHEGTLSPGNETRSPYEKASRRR